MTVTGRGEHDTETRDPFYDITEGDWRVVAEEVAPGEARIRFWYQGQPFREIGYPSYKVWNVPAHLHDIAADFEHGMSLASWPGFPALVWS